MADKVDVEMKKLLGQILEQVGGIERQVKDIKQSAPAGDMSRVENAIAGIGDYIDKVSGHLAAIVEGQDYLDSRLASIEKSIASMGARPSIRPAAENLQQKTDEQRKSILRKTHETGSAVNASREYMKNYMKKPYDK